MTDAVHRLKLSKYESHPMSREKAARKEDRRKSVYFSLASCEARLRNSPIKSEER